jgi:hypothetical protein
MLVHLLLLPLLGSDIPTRSSGAANDLQAVLPVSRYQQFVYPGSPSTNMHRLI